MRYSAYFKGKGTGADFWLSWTLWQRINNLPRFGGENQENQKLCSLAESSNKRSGKRLLRGQRKTQVLAVKLDGFEVPLCLEWRCSWLSGHSERWHLRPLSVSFLVTVAEGLRRPRVATSSDVMLGCRHSPSLVDKRLSTANRSQCLKMKGMPLPPRSQVQSIISPSTQWLVQPGVAGHETCRNLA